ncbi:MAG: hypothetical protein LBE48_04775 [Methanomassiliicoccaceae archaeon]|jgi:hypothetical protein|nr:hypothetical protein [Methanomassiliicoccaceae archaeon]
MRSKDTDGAAGVHLSEWYSSLNDQQKIMFDRYSKKVNETSQSSSTDSSFLQQIADAALKDENYAFAVTICEECLSRGITNIHRFDIIETLIDAYIGTKRYDDAKRICEDNLKLIPSVIDDIKAKNNGKMPEKMNCRNRYVDVVVGIESGYDKAFELLDRFFSMGLISPEDLALRKQSLKIHRLQRSFDGVYTYTYKE